MYAYKALEYLNVYIRAIVYGVGVNVVRVAYTGSTQQEGNRRNVRGERENTE